MCVMFIFSQSLKRTKVCMVAIFKSLFTKVKPTPKTHLKIDLAVFNNICVNKYNTHC